MARVTFLPVSLATECMPYVYTFSPSANSAAAAAAAADIVDPSAFSTAEVSVTAAAAIVVVVVAADLSVVDHSVAVLLLLPFQHYFRPVQYG